MELVFEVIAILTEMMQRSENHYSFCDKYLFPFDRLKWAPKERQRARETAATTPLPSPPSQYLCNSLG